MATTNRPPTPRTNPVLTTPDRPSDWPNPNDLATLTTGHTDRPEPHPWGAPLLGYGPPDRRRAFGQWLAYALTLTVVVVVVVVVALYGRSLTNATSAVPVIESAPVGGVVDTLESDDSSRYHGPNHPTTEPATGAGAGR